MRNQGWRGLVGVALALAAIALPVGAQPYKSEYSLSIVPDAGTPWAKGTQLWVDMVRERTRGRINIRLHPGAALVGGDQTREFTALRQGVIDMAVGSTINWSSARSVIAVQFGALDATNAASERLATRMIWSRVVQLASSSAASWSTAS